MRNVITSIIISVFFLSCQPSIKKEDRINASFNFQEVLYSYYDDQDYGGLLPHSGSITINKNKITVEVNADNQNVVESFSIENVTYDQPKNKYKYQTNAGEFIVEMKNQQVKGVTHYYSEAVTNFYQENKTNKNTVKSQKQTYLEFDSTMLIDKDYINYAEEFGMTNYSEQHYFYGVITNIDKNFKSFKIKILKSNQENMDDLGYDITGLEWDVMMDQVNYLDNSEMCESCASDFKKLMVKGRKLKFSMVEGCAGCGTSMNGVWFLTYATEFNDEIKAQK
ncbi:MAG: hypothetical protein ACOH2D_17190 [Gelidibacter sp.]